MVGKFCVFCEKKAGLMLLPKGGVAFKNKGPERLMGVFMKDLWAST